MNLDHGFAKDLSERLSLESGGSESGGYNTHDASPKLGESGHVSACSHRRCNRHTSHEAMDDPRFRVAGRTKRRR